MHLHMIVIQNIFFLSKSINSFVQISEKKFMKLKVSKQQEDPHLL
jgi:hypothetical protein